MLGRGGYKWISRGDKQKKINRQGSRLGMPVLLVLGRIRREDQEGKVILCSFSYFFHYFVGSPYCLLTVSPLPQWSPIFTLFHLFPARSSPLWTRSVLFLLHGLLYAHSYPPSVLLSSASWTLLFPEVQEATTAGGRKGQTVLRIKHSQKGHLPSNCGSFKEPGIQK